MSLSAGTKLGPYEIFAPLGAGGMGEVYRARDTRLGRDVAVKVVHPQLASDPERLSRFEKEARAAAQLDHPNILVVHDVGTHEGSPFIVSELLQGESLREKLGTPLSPKKAVDYAIQIAHGLAAAHEKGIVHRDIKPENVFVTKDGHVKILDFGVAKLLPSFEPSGVDTETPTESATQPGTALGTVAYMSPEQIRGQPVDARSDLFSLGVVLYEMLSGKRPFQRETAADTMSAILREEPSVISGAGQGIPPVLDKIVRHCLEKDSSVRTQTAREVIFALETLSTLSGEAPVQTTAPIQTDTWLRRHRTAFAGAALHFAAIVGGGFWWRSRSVRPVAGNLPSVLALPCKVYGAPEAEYLTDAVPGTISTLLSQVEGIDTKVPPTSIEVDKVKGDLTMIAELYQVSSFIVTSITASPGRFALNVQLVDAATRKVKWGKQYEGARESYNDLARQAAEGICLAVRPAALPIPTAGVSSEAELAFRQGTYLANRYNNLQRPADFEAALMAYTSALKLDPSFAVAAAKVAVLYVFRFEVEADLHETRRQAESWARRALGIDPRCGEAWAALSGLELYATHANPERGIDSAAKAVALAPRDAGAHAILGMWLGGPGSYSLFVASGLRAFDLDPFLLPPAGNAAAGLCLLGRPREALTVIDRALRVEPDFAWGLTARAFALLKLGRLDEAERELRRSGADATKGYAGGELWRQIRFPLAVAQGDKAMSEALARQILASVFDNQADANLVSNAMMFAASPLVRMGKTDDAIRILEKGVEVGVPPPYDWLLVEHDFQTLHGDPRFVKVLAAARDGAAKTAKILDEARARGELPKYLEAPLDDLLKLLNENGAKS